MLASYSGATRVYFILGDPIAQVKAPAGLTGEFQRRGRNAIVVPLQIAPADIGEGIAALSRAANVDGLIATIPHKFELVAHCATLSDRARFLGVANVARRNVDRSWHGDMLDGEGFADGIAEAGCRFEGRRALLIGAGGAGSAIGLALLERGVATLAVHDNDPARRDALIGKLAAKFGDRVLPGSDNPADAEILVNATPRGMALDDAMPVDLSRLAATTFVGDVITIPEVTPLLQAARARGCMTQTGIGMFLNVLGRMAEFFEVRTGDR